MVDVNDTDVDALLPPRKRLLAGLKRQNFDVNFHIPVDSCSTMSEFDTRVNNLLKSHLISASHFSEDVVEASRLAAMKAAKVAEAARATAEEKAAKAAKAVASAKSALELVDILSEQATSNEKSLNKNKTKKRDPVRALYNKDKGVRNCKMDEELTRKLHFPINNAARISKKFSSSDLKRKRVKRLATKVQNSETKCGRKSTTSKFGNVDHMNVENIEGLRSDKIDRLELENGEVKMMQSKEKSVESFDDLSSFGKSRGKIKQNLSSSICNFRDQLSLKNKPKSKSKSHTEEKPSNKPGLLEDLPVTV